MSAEAVRNLKLSIIWDDQASGPAKAFRDSRMRDIRDITKEQEKSNAAYVRAIYQNLAAAKQLEAEKIRGIRNAAKEQATANRQANSLLKDLARDETRIARETAAAKRRADKETFQQWKMGADFRHKLTMKAWSDEQAAIRGSRSELADLIKTGAGLGAIHEVAGAIGSEFEKAYEYIDKTARQFADVRQAIIQVAALRDKAPTNKFTMEQAAQAEKAGLTPQQWFRAQEDFLNPAAAQIGNGPGAKMNDAQAQEFETRVARLTASKLGGDNAGVGMGFAGAILQQSKGPLTPDQAMAQFNPAFEVLQKGSIDLRRAMPMMSQVMAHDISPTNAAELLNVVAPAAPNEELTSAEGALRAIEEMRVSGKGAEFGVTDKMTKMEAIKAFTKNMGERAATLRAKGKTDEEIDVDLARQLKEADVAAEIRERRGLIRGMYRQGVELGGFERYEGIAAKTAPDYDIGAVKDFEKSEEGKAARRRARSENADVKSGARGDRIAALRMEAETLLKESGRFEKTPGVAEGILGNLPVPGVASTREQQINRVLIGSLRNQLGEQRTMSDNWAALNNKGTNEQVERLLARLDEQNKLLNEQNQLMKADAAQGRRNANPPMPNAVPPMPRGR